MKTEYAVVILKGIDPLNPEEEEIVNVFDTEDEALKLELEIAKDVTEEDTHVAIYEGLFPSEDMIENTLYSIIDIDSDNLED